MDNSRSPVPPILLTDGHPLLDDDCACPDSPRIFAMNQDSVIENDCACPASVGAPSAQSTESRLYRQAEGVYVDSLPHGFRLAFSPYAPQGPSALNAPA